MCVFVCLFVCVHQETIQFNLLLSLLVCLFVRPPLYPSVCLPPLSFVPTVTAVQAVQPRVRRNHLWNEIVSRRRQTSRKPAGIRSDLKGLILWMVPPRCVRADREDTQCQRVHVRPGSTRAQLHADRQTIQFCRVFLSSLFYFEMCFAANFASCSLIRLTCV